MSSPTPSVQLPSGGAIGPPVRPTGTGTIIFGATMIVSPLVVYILAPPFGLFLALFLTPVVGALISAKINRARVAVYCAVAAVGIASAFTAQALDTPGGAINGPAVLGFLIGTGLFLTGAIGVIVEGSRARRLSAEAVSATSAPVPMGYTVEGRPIYPVVGYTSDGVAVTADRAVGATPVPAGTNSMAIAALVGGLVLAPVGIVCGHIALSQTTATHQAGRGLAIAGLVIGYSWTALTVVAIVGMSVATQI